MSQPLFPPLLDEPATATRGPAPPGLPDPERRRQSAALFPAVRPGPAARSQPTGTGPATWPPQASGWPGEPVDAAVQAAFERGLATGRQQGLVQGHREGRAAGHAEGLAQGLAQGQKEGQALAWDAAREDLAAQAESQARAQFQAETQHFMALSASLPQALVQAEEALAVSLMDLALALAQRVVGAALAHEPALMLPAVRELLQAEPALVGQPQLLLHPDDLALVREHLADEFQVAGWRLRAEPAIERGGCRVLAASGELDARLSTRWQRVAAALACEPVVAHVQEAGA